MATVPLKGRIIELDGVRGIAILMVIYGHYFAAQPHPESGPVVRFLAQAGGLSSAGVDLFFVLSGFLIGGILIDNRGATNLLPAFYARRSLRIFPLYYVWLGLFVVLSPLLRDRVPWLFRDPVPLWTYATYTQNFAFAARGEFGEAHWLAMTWSLAVEEQFYLILPFIFLVFRPRAVLMVSIVLAGTAPLLRGLTSRAGYGFGAGTLLWSRWDSLFLGVIGAFAIRNVRVRAWLGRHVHVVHVAFLGLMGAFWLLTFRPSLNVSTLRPTILSLFFLSLLAVALVSPYRRVLRFRPLTATGGIAYGLYMFHQGVNGLTHGLTHGGEPRTRSPADWGLTALALALTFVIATLSYRFFEAPLIRVGHRVGYRRPISDAVLPAAAPAQ